MVGMSPFYGSCDAAANSNNGGVRRSGDAITHKLMAVSALVLISTLAAVAIVSSVDTRTSNIVLTSADVNLAQSDQLLTKVKALLAQEQAISTDVHQIETGPILDAAPPAPAPAAAAPAAAVAPAGAATAAAPVVAAADAAATASTGSSAPVAAASGTASGATAASASAAAVKTHKHHTQTDVQDKRKDYEGFVGGSMSEADDKLLPPELPADHPGVFDETKKARFILICMVLIGLAGGIYAAVRNVKSSSITESAGAAYEPHAYTSQPEYTGTASSTMDVQSARDKLAAVQEQHAAARRQLQEQQQRLAVAQQHLSQQEQV